jgi:GT2 family glycosyltransferase
MDEAAISVGIVNFNGEWCLPDTLASLKCSLSPLADILFVDNGSTDGSVQLARSHLPAARVIELGENRGPGAARNAAVRSAKHDRVLLIDNDVVPQAGCAAALSRVLDAHPKAVIATPAILYTQDPQTVQYAGADAHVAGLPILLHAEEWCDRLEKDPRLVSSLVSACLMVDRARWGGGEWFDEAMFFYLEDHEMGLRAALLGYDVVCVPTARCLHGKGQPGVSIRQTGRFTPTRVRYTIRNRWQVLLKLYEWQTLLRFAPALLAFEVFQLLGAIKKGWLHHWMWAVGSQVRNGCGLMKRRRAFQRIRKCRDVDILRGGPVPYNKAMHVGRVERAARDTLDWIVQLNWRLAGGRR